MRRIFQVWTGELIFIPVAGSRISGYCFALGLGYRDNLPRDNLPRDNSVIHAVLYFAFDYRSWDKNTWSHAICVTYKTRRLRIKKQHDVTHPKGLLLSTEPYSSSQEHKDRESHHQLYSNYCWFFPQMNCFQLYVLIICLNFAWILRIIYVILCQ